MEKLCVMCKGEGKYKCPTCLVFYCSVQCCNKHRENACDVWVKDDAGGPQMVKCEQSKPRYTTVDTVPLQKLVMLKDDEHLKNLLCNPHLREFLVKVNNSSEVEKMMQLAMQEPLFTEFADACLKVVEPRDETD